LQFATAAAGEVINNLGYRTYLLYVTLNIVSGMITSFTKDIKYV